MHETFADILAVGGKSNSLGRASEVTEAVLNDRALIEELYTCLFDVDAWTRMRAADSLEKVCRVHPDWLSSYVDKFQTELSSSNQPSIQWHLAQIYRQVSLTSEQKDKAIIWMKDLLATIEVDWIVAANSMSTLAQFAKDGSVSKTELKILLEIQLKHRSKSVVKRASKLLSELG